MILEAFPSRGTGLGSAPFYKDLTNIQRFIVWKQSKNPASSMAWFSPVLCTPSSIQPCLSHRATKSCGFFLLYFWGKWGFLSVNYWHEEDGSAFPRARSLTGLSPGHSKPQSHEHLRVGQRPPEQEPGQGSCELRVCDHSSSIPAHLCFSASTTLQEHFLSSGKTHNISAFNLAAGF